MTFDIPDFLDLAYEKNRAPIRMRINISTFDSDQLLKVLVSGFRILTYPKAAKFCGKIVTAQAVFPQEMELQSM